MRLGAHKSKGLGPFAHPPPLKVVDNGGVWYALSETTLPLLRPLKFDSYTYVNLNIYSCRTVPKTTSGKIARSMCKRAHVAGTLDGDTIFMWGEPITSAAARDATAEKDEAPSSPNGGGVEESKFSGGPSGVGGRGDPREMAEADILLGVQSEVARILKADALSIPTVSEVLVGWWMGLSGREVLRLPGVSGGRSGGWGVWVECGGVAEFISFCAKLLCCRQYYCDLLLWQAV